jgi:hypothetical protein
VQAGLVPQRQPPVAQLSALLALQAVQVAPLMPQAVIVLPFRQALPSQQPAQVSGSQTQMSPWQRSPSSQGVPRLPHEQAPPAVH